MLYCKRDKLVHFYLAKETQHTPLLFSRRGRWMSPGGRIQLGWLGSRKAGNECILNALFYPALSIITL